MDNENIIALSTHYLLPFTPGVYNFFGQIMKMKFKKFKSPKEFEFY